MQIHIPDMKIECESGDSVDVGDPWHPLWEMLLESRSELAPYFVDGETEALSRDLSRSELFK